MPFFSNTFREDGGPDVLIHARWEEGRPTASRLWLFTQRSHAEEFVHKLPMNERDEFRTSLATFWTFHDSPFLHLRGAVAQSFIHDLVEFAKDPVAATLIDKPQICFGWNPVPMAPDEAIVCWFVPESGFTIAFLHSKQQGLTLVEKLDWLSPGDREKLLNKIGTWPDDPSSDPVNVTGPIARVLGLVSTVSKTRQMAKRKAN
jgi:hypothetical protein